MNDPLRELPQGRGPGTWRLVLLDEFGDLPRWSAIICCPNCHTMLPIPITPLQRTVRFRHPWDIRSANADGTCRQSCSGGRAAVWRRDRCLFTSARYARPRHDS